MIEFKPNLRLMPGERPMIRKGQVVEASELKIGASFVFVGRLSTRRITILSKPHKLEKLPNAKGLFVDALEDTSRVHSKYPNIPPSQKTIISLADAGIIPYEDGTWNPTNHIFKILF